MKKGQKKRIWTKEQKSEIINKHLKDHVSVRTIEKEYNVDRSLVCHRIRDYNESGEKALEPKARSITRKVGSSLPYYHCLDVLIEKTREQTHPVTLHTDQGSVYSSSGFYQAHKNYTNIKRSMSGVGTPADNPIIESLNGCIKEEMRKDFNLRNVDNIPLFIENYVHYFNNERLSYKLNYKTPVPYKIEQGLDNWWFLLTAFT